MNANTKQLYPDEIKFLRDNHLHLNHSQIHTHINSNRGKNNKIGKTTLRTRMYKMGLKKGIQIPWSKKDIKRLKAWYTFIGDTQIAEMLNQVGTTSRKIKGEKVCRNFTKKQVNKKRRLLGLKRTSHQVNRIVADNILLGEQGCFTSKDNLWTNGTKTPAIDEEIRIWKRNGKEKRVIKIDGNFIPYTRWFYHNFISPISPTQLIFHIDLDTLNDDASNLEIRTRKTISVKKTDYARAKPLIEKRIEKQLKFIDKNYDKAISLDKKRQMMKELTRLKSILKNINSHLNTTL